MNCAKPPRHLIALASRRNLQIEMVQDWELLDRKRGAGQTRESSQDFTNFSPRSTRTSDVQATIE